MGLLVVVLFMFGYPAWFIFALWNFLGRQGATGRTIGKSIIGISTVGDLSGRAIGGTDIFLRQLVHLLDLISIVGFLWPLWDPRRETFADKICGSRVINGRPVDSAESVALQAGSPVGASGRLAAGASSGASSGASGSTAGGPSNAAPGPAPAGGAA